MVQVSKTNIQVTPQVHTLSLTGIQVEQITPPTLSLVGVPTVVRRGNHLNFRVMGVEKAYVSSDFTVYLAGKSLTVDSVTVPTGGGIDVATSIPDTLAAKYGSVNLTVELDRATVSTPITFLPVASRDYIDITSATADLPSVYTNYTHTNQTAGQQIEFDRTTAPGGLAVSVSSSGKFSVGGNPTTNQLFNYRAIEPTGALRAISTATYQGDSTKPIIVVNNGVLTATVIQGGVFGIPSYQATDNKDGNITSQVVVTGSIDTSVLGNQVLTYNVTDAAGNAADPVRFTLTVIEAPDTEKPVITIVGGTSYTVTQGANWSNPVAIVSDNRDSDLIATVTGAIDTSVLGEHRLVYRAIDRSGNQALPVTVTVNVVLAPDTEKPVITLPDGLTYTTYQNQSFTYPTVIVTDNRDSGLVAVRTGSVDTTTLGSYVLHYNVQDTAGNKADEVTATVSVIQMPDTEKPVLNYTGPTVLTTIQNQSFTYPTVTVTDNRDSGLVAIRTGTVDTTTVGSYQLRYNVTDAAGNAADELVITVNVVLPADLTKPVITIAGNNSITVIQGTTFTYPTVTATDDRDGDISGNVIRTGAVDISTLGEYLLKYNVSDAAGNAAEEVVVTVTVIQPVDATIPTISVPLPHVMEVYLGGSFTPPTPTATDNKDGDISHRVILTGAVDTSTIGTYRVTYNVTDSAGNQALPVTITVNVVLAPDTVAPTIEIPTGLNYQVYLNEAFTYPTYTASDDRDGNITSQVIVTGSVDTTTAGIYPIRYNVSDAAGNPAPQKTVIVTVIERPDITPPVITIPTGLTYTVHQNEVFTIPLSSATDDRDGDITNRVVISGTINTATLGPQQLRYNVTDAAGNAAEEVVVSVTILPPPDTEKPVITVAGSLSYAIYEGSSWIEPTVTAADNKDGDITSAISRTGTVDTTTVGSYQLRYNVTDAAGNAADEVTVNVQVLRIPDTQPPTLTSNAGTTFTVQQGRTFTPPSVRAIDDRDGDISSSVQVTGTIDTNIVSTQYLRYTVADAAGNSSDPLVVTVNVVPAPAGEKPVIAIPGGLNYVVHQNEPFIAPRYVALDHNDMDITSQVTVTGAVDTSVLGIHQIRYDVQDGDGVAADTVTITVNVVLAPDTEKPVITISQPLSYQVVVGDVFVLPTATAIDQRDGDLTSQITTDGTVDTSTIGTYLVYYHVTDAAGNKAEPLVVRVNVIPQGDRVRPVLHTSASITQTVVRGATWINPLVSAIDDVDGDISSHITLSGFIDTTVLGSQQLRYNVTDAAGNAAEELVITVTVIPSSDITPPVITIPTGLSYTVAQGHEFVLPAPIAIDDVDGDISNDIVTIGAVDTSVLGSHLVRYQVTDRAGNQASDVTITVTVVTGSEELPILWVIRSLPSKVYVGHTVPEPLVKAYDGTRTDISQNIVQSGVIDTSVTGIQQLRYNVTDGTGRAAKELVLSTLVVPVPPRGNRARITYVSDGLGGVIRRVYR